MKRVSFIFTALLLAACSTPRADRMELTDWQYEYEGQWYAATVPGFIHTDVLKIDPYYGTNEAAVEWVSNRPWVYTTRVLKKDLPKDEMQYLVFEGVAGMAELTINDELVGYFENMFVRYEIPFMHDFPGDTMNIRLTLWPLPAAKEDPKAVMMDGIPMSDSLLEVNYGIPLPDRRAFWRVAPYQMGWDWGPKMPTCGIWKPVYITSQRPNGQSIQNNQNTPKVELRQEQDSIGQSFTFYRDGKPIFIKGANWIPVHSFPVDDSANRARYRLLLTSAKEAGFNMLRVWGGGIYEHDYFFDLCDSLGLMVWMDFNFSTMLYPDDSLMLKSIKEEAYQNVSRIAQHPCVVLWCGNNEVKNGWEDWGWQGVYKWSPEQRARLEHGIDTIFGYSNNSNHSKNSILAQAVRDCDPMHRPYITTSPLYGWGHPECVSHGDSHYWGIWWGEEPFEKYAEKTGRFMSEYGFQSYPMLSTIRRFCPEDQLDINSPTLRSHQKHGRGLEIIDKAMQRYYGFDSKSLNLEDFCYVSQLLQAWGTGYGIFQHIKQQPHCMGTLYWQLNDCWPVASWSSIDYYGNWKALHYRVQALYSLTPEGDGDKDLRYWEKYYSVYPKDRTYPTPKFNSHYSVSNTGLTVTLTAESDLYDVYIDTKPHIDGHFSRNFFDLKSGESVTATFVPVDKRANLRNVEVTVKTLNEVMGKK